jgi:hypothetical protein
VHQKCTASKKNNLSQLRAGIGSLMSESRRRGMVGDNRLLLAPKFVLTLLLMMKCYLTMKGSALATLIWNCQTQRTHEANPCLICARLAQGRFSNSRQHGG